nr:hypothetical protein GCM10017745_64010 [Saccharothrix mutabilis subsp. capreolus]
MIDLPPRRTWPPLAVQIVGVWVAALVGFIGTGWLTVLGFVLRSPGLVAVSLLGPLVMFFLVGSLSQPAGLLTRRLLPRAAWALAVTTLGTLGAVFYMSVLESSEPAKPPTWLATLGVGLPYALITAALVRPLAIRLTSLATTAAAIALGIHLPTTLPQDDARSRIENAKLPGNVLLLATPNAYDFPTLTRKDNEATLDYRPTGKDHPLSPWPQLTIRQVSPPQPGDVQEDTLTYRTWTRHHVYLRRDHGVEIAATVPDDVPKEAVQTFILSVRPATDEETMRLLPRDPTRKNRDVLQHFTQTLNHLTP